MLYGIPGAIIEPGLCPKCSSYFCSIFVIFQFSLFSSLEYGFVRGVPLPFIKFLVVSQKLFNWIARFRDMFPHFIWWYIVLSCQLMQPHFHSFSVSNFEYHVNIMNTYLTFNVLLVK